MPTPLKDEILKRLEANYNLKNIRQDLISRGFSPKEVDKAIEEALDVFMKVSKDKGIIEKQSIKSKASLPYEKLSTFQKIKMILTSPRELFSYVAKEELKDSMEYFFILVLMIVVFSSVVLFFTLKIHTTSTSFGVFGIFKLLFSFISLTGGRGIFSTVVLLSIFILLYLGYSLGYIIIQALYLHLFVRIVGIKGGGWDSTLKAMIYSFTTIIYIIPIMMFLPYIFIKIIGSGALIVYAIFFFVCIGWYIVVLSIGISELYQTSFLRSLIAVTLCIVSTVLLICLVYLDLKSLFSSLPGFYYNPNLNYYNYTIPDLNLSIPDYVSNYNLSIPDLNLSNLE